MAKKFTNMIEYGLKGELIELEESIIKTQVVKTNTVETDTVNLNEMLIDIHQFCNDNKEKNIEMKLLMKVVEE